MKYETKTLRAGIAEYGLSVSDEMIDRLVSFYEHLVETNRVMNLTAITDWERVVAKHFLDSLALLSVVRPEELNRCRILDLGTGAGFPGIPLAIFLPDTHFMLADSLKKRVGFLETVIRELSLSNVTAVHARAEDLAREETHREQYDFVLSRAVANLSTLSEYCLPFVKVGGTFVSYKAEDVEEELAAAETAISLLGGEVSVVSRFTIPTTELPRSLILIKKKTASPARFPRKAGTPAKKPLC